jgi:Ca-activated chloride channel family protein
MSDALELWHGLEFRNPGLLMLAGLVPLAVWIRHRFGASALWFAPGPRGPGSPETEGVPPRLPRSLSVRLASLPRWLQAVALLLVAVALARPVERSPLPLTTEGIDILLALDVSSSMATEDMDAGRTRLDVAKEAASRFLAGRPHDRIGLVTFARYPDLRCPLTLDHLALDEILRGVEMVTRDGPEDATGIGAALMRSAQVLGQHPETSKVLILLTDGEENVATSRTPDEIAPLHGAQLCASRDVRVYTIAAGIGSPSPSGTLIPLDTSQVRQVARRTGGRFFEARDAKAIDGVYAAIDDLERARFAEPRYAVNERFLPFLLLALVLMVVGRVLEATVLEVLP